MSPLRKDTKQVPAKSCRTPEHFSFKRYLWKINPFLSCYYGYGITINFHPPYSKCYKISLKFKLDIEIPAATESIAFLESFWSVLQNSTGPAGPCIKYRSMAPLIYFIYFFFWPSKHGVNQGSSPLQTWLPLTGLKPRYIFIFWLHTYTHPYAYSDPDAPMYTEICK